MKKTLSIIMALCMVLSVCFFSVSAAEATVGSVATGYTPAEGALAITDAAGFAAMEPDGNYYLAKDISISSTYENAFSGTFDGCGRTITVSAPMFKEFNGTIKNLVLKGSIDGGDRSAAVAQVSVEGMTAINITSNVDINANFYAASIVCEATSVDNVSTFTDIINNGEITVKSEEIKPRAGGIGAIINNGIFTNCINNADILCTGSTSVAGGICARPALKGPKSHGDFYYCVNNGDISANDTGDYKSEAGGICGYLGNDNNKAVYNIWGCVNTGDISATLRVGGIAPYVYAKKNYAYIDLQFCINTGNITYGHENKSSSSYGSGIIAYANSTVNIIANNIDYGKINYVGPDDSEWNQAFVYCSSGITSMAANNFILDYSSYPYYSYAVKEENETQRILAEGNDYTEALVLDDLHSGDLVKTINDFADSKPYSAVDCRFIHTGNLPVIKENYTWTYTNGRYYYRPATMAVNGAYTYTGSPIIPEVSFTIDNKELVEGVDYTLSGENNVNAGTATVTATLIGNYSGSISKEFTIAPREVVLVWENTDMMYNGERQTPAAKLFGVVAGDVCDVTVSGWGKFGGTYTAKVESISNENYVLSGDTTCQFTIIANPIEVAIDVACDIYDIIPDSAKQAVADAAVEAAKNAASDLANAAYEVASDLADTAIEAAETKAAEIKDTVESAYDQARDFFTGLFGSFSFFG